MSANQDEVRTLPLSLFWAVSYRTGDKARNAPTSFYCLTPSHISFLKTSLALLKQFMLFYENLGIITIGK